MVQTILLGVITLGLFFQREARFGLTDFAQPRDVSFSDTVYPLASGYEKNSSELPSMSVYEYLDLLLNLLLKRTLKELRLKQYTELQESSMNLFLTFLILKNTA